MTLRVEVVGPGAVGSFLGATLARAGHDVTLVGRSEVPSPGRGELRLVEAGGETRVPVTRAGIDDAAAEAPDVVLLAVKLFDLAPALATVERSPDAPVLTVQNGIGAEQMAAKLRASPVVAGSLTTAVEPITGGVSQAAAGRDRGRGCAGRRCVPPGVARRGLRGRRAPARVYPDAVAMKWSKLIANLVGNASGAILDMDPGAIYRDPAGFDVDRRQLLEARAVMRRLGAGPVDLPGAPIRPLLFGLRLPALLGAAGAGARDRRRQGRQVALAAAARPGRRRASAAAGTHGGAMAQRGRGPRGDGARHGRRRRERQARGAGRRGRYGSRARRVVRRSP